MSKKVTYESACKSKGITPLTLAHFDFMPENQRKAHYSLHRLETINEVIHNGRKFDWNDYSQKKWFPYFNMKTYNKGRENDGFVLNDVNYFYSHTVVSPRLCSFSIEEAESFVNDNLEDWKNFMGK